MKDKKSSIQLLKINLLQLNFSLGGFSASKGHEARMNIGIETIDNKEDTIVSSIVRVLLSHEDIKDFTFHVMMRGDFQIIGEIEFSKSDFLNINAPAIIFPYIRQIVRHIFLESGESLILPIVDFVALYEARNKNKTED